MKSSDFVNQLALKLPSLVDDFTTNLSVISLTRSGTTVTATTASAHGLVVGKAVNIVGAKSPIVIGSIERNGIVATLITDTDHDMTEGAFTEVEIEGATESEFNGVFPLLSVSNRRAISFKVSDAGPISVTGAPLLLNGESPLRSYNGLHQVTDVPTTDSFTYEITNNSVFTPASGDILAKILPRISASVGFDRILDAYTQQPQDEAWLFVVMGDGIANKNRKIDIDSTDNTQRSHYFEQRITQVVSLFLFIPTSAQIAGRKARDRAEELLRPICQSILFQRFDSLLSSGSFNPLQFNEHGFEAYNRAFYVHRYTFEATLQMSFEDTVGFDEDVAFRDIFLTMGLDVGTETFNTDIDLDDAPLP